MLVLAGVVVARPNPRPAVTNIWSPRTSPTPATCGKLGVGGGAGEHGCIQPSLPLAAAQQLIQAQPFADRLLHHAS